MSVTSIYSSGITIVGREGKHMFRSLTFSENRLRADAGLTQRSDYRSNGILNSFFGYDMKAVSEGTARPDKTQDTY